MIRTVLIAGGQKEDSNVAKFLHSHFIRYSTVLVLPTAGRSLPDHDAAITVVTTVSRELSSLVRQEYKGKPQYVITHGVSNIKDQFLTDVYGIGVYKRLTDLSTMVDADGNALRGGVAGDYFHLKARIMWLLARFYEKGTTIQRNEFGKRIDNYFGLIDKGGPSLSSINHGHPDSLENVKRGEFVFRGIPNHWRQIYMKFGLPYKNEWFMDYRSTPIIPSTNNDNLVIIRKAVDTNTPTQKTFSYDPHDQSSPDSHMRRQLEEAKNRLVAEKNEEEQELLVLEPLEKEITSPSPAPTTIGEQQQGTTAPLTTEEIDDMSAQWELLLDSMARQQEQIAELAKMEDRVREVIQDEIRGITKLVGDIVPQLQGLHPDQLDKVKQMIDLMLSMNNPKRA